MTELLAMLKNWRAAYALDKAERELFDRIEAALSPSPSMSAREVEAALDVLDGFNPDAVSHQAVAAALLAASKARATTEVEVGDAWQDIATAPKDGTRIFIAEVTEDYTNVMEARWCTLYGPNDREPPKDGLMTGWWGLSWRVGDSEWPGVKSMRELSPFGRAENLALHPTHWRPMPAKPVRSALVGGE